MPEIFFLLLTEHGWGSRHEGCQACSDCSFMVHFLYVCVIIVIVLAAMLLFFHCL
jgi:hypothetical protein